MPITQKELAELLNLSQMTVSRCLRKSSAVGAATRARVLDAARTHGYTLDAHFEASAMQRRRMGQPHVTNVICAIIWDPTHDPYGFNHRILDGVCDDALKSGNEVIIAPRMGTEFPRVVRRKQVDGIVRMLGEAALRCADVPCPVPWVSILYDVPGPDVVSIDHCAATRDLGRHLGRLGHRRFAFLGPDTALARQRLEGLRQAAKEFGGDVPEAFTALIRHFKAFEQTGNMVAALADRAAAAPESRFTALVAYNDLMALEAIRTLHAKGIRVPQDVSVAGFDGIAAVQPDQPRLTTVAVPLEELGAEASRLVTWRLLHPDLPRRRRILKTTLIEGESVGRVK